MKENESSKRKDDLLEIFKRDISGLLIQGKWGSGKTTTIKNILENFKYNDNDNDNDNDNEYKKKKYYSIINASSLKTLDINSAAYHNHRVIGEDNDKNKTTIDEGFVNKASKFFVSISSSLDEKPMGGIIGAGAMMANSIYGDYKNNFLLDDFILIIDEIDRLPKSFNLDDLLSKVIDVKEKYKNILVVLVANKEKVDNFNLITKWEEKLFDNIYDFTDDVNNISICGEYSYLYEQYKNILVEDEYNLSNFRVKKQITLMNDYFSNFMKKNDLRLSNDKIREIRSSIFMSNIYYFEKSIYVDNYIKNWTKRDSKSEDIAKANAMKGYELKSHLAKSFYYSSTEKLDELILSNASDNEDYLFSMKHEEYLNKKREAIISGFDLGLFLKDFFIKHNKDLCLLIEPQYSRSMIFWLIESDTICVNFDYKFYLNQVNVQLDKLKELITSKGNNNYDYLVKMIDKLERLKTNKHSKRVDAIMQDSICNIDKLIELSNSKINALEYDINSSQKFKIFLAKKDQKTFIINEIQNTKGLNSTIDELVTTLNVVDKNAVIEILEDIFRDNNKSINIKRLLKAYI